MDLLSSPSLLLISSTALVGLVILFYLYSLFKPKPLAPSPFTNGGDPGKKPVPSPVVKAQVPRKKERKGPPMKIYYGSQTGTAEDFSKILSTEAKKYGFDPDVVDLEGVSVEDLREEKLAVFVVATYGDGEPTDNAKDFYDALLSPDVDPEIWSRLQYTVFGLGNKTYPHYNAVARALDKRAAELGALRVFERGEGDDDACLEEDFNRWKKRLWRPICEKFELSAPSELSSDSQIVAKKYRIEYFKEAPATGSESIQVSKSSSTTINAGQGYDPKNPMLRRIFVNRELHSPLSDRSCRHIEFDILGCSYEAGDHLAVCPENDEILVNELASLLHLSPEDLDKTFALYPIEGKSTSTPAMGPCTIRHALTSVCDINGLVRKSVIKGLVQYATDETEKKHLIELCKDEDESSEDSVNSTSLFHTYIRAGQRTVIELLKEHPSCNVPVEHLLELLPRLQPRYYSISSSQKLHPYRVHITCILLTFTSPTGRVHQGVCSHYLAKLKTPEDESAPLESFPTARIFLRKSTFHLPKDLRTPILMIGPGTGLAPFRGFLQDRLVALSSSNNPNPTQGLSSELESEVIDALSTCSSSLFFGCRDRTKDYIYAEELEEFVKKKVTRLSLAFSREQEHKVYVTDRLRENKHEIWKEILSHPEGHVYICGDGKSMAKSVHTIFKEIVMEAKSCTEEEATLFLNKLTESGRYLMDVW